MSNASNLRDQALYFVAELAAIMDRTQLRGWPQQQANVFRARLHEINVKAGEDSKQPAMLVVDLAAGGGYGAEGGAAGARSEVHPVGGSEGRACAKSGGEKAEALMRARADAAEREADRLVGTRLFS